MKRILVAYDGDEPAHRALERASTAWSATLTVARWRPRQRRSKRWQKPGTSTRSSSGVAAWVRSVASCREASPSTSPRMQRRRSSLPADGWIRFMG